MNQLPYRVSSTKKSHIIPKKERSGSSMVTVRESDSHMSLVHAAKHKDKANTSALPTCSRLKCLVKVNTCQCTCKYLKNTWPWQTE